MFHGHKISGVKSNYNTSHSGTYNVNVIHVVIIIFFERVKVISKGGFNIPNSSAYLSNDSSQYS